MSPQQRLLVDIKAQRAAPRDYRDFAQGLRVEVVGAKALNMPLSARVIAEYARIADRAAKAEVDDPMPDDFKVHDCNECLAYLWGIN